MRYIKADLHIHSVLSPCGGLLMTPQNIINRALNADLGLIAITDHNSAENIEVALKLAQNTSLKILPGMEVESSEEVHLLCLFDTLEQVLAWQKIVYSALPEIKNNEDIFGPQLLTDINDDYSDRVDRLLLTATNLSIKEIVLKVRGLGGIVIPAHIDKKNYSLISNLGFIPPGLDVFSLEIFDMSRVELLIDKFNTIDKYTLISNSDAHYLQDIRMKSKFYIETTSIKELEMALKGESGRKVLI